MTERAVGPYRILDKIGEGGMGEVYRARDLRLKRDVALKLLPPSFAGDPARFARFQREAEILAALDHPHIASIYGIEERDGVTALVLQLVEGDTLADRIARGPLPADEALRIAGQVAQALAAAHGQGIVHRDLKPSNIAIAPDGGVKVLDFGLAKLADPPFASGSDPSLSPTITSPAMLTGHGVLLGTAAYMSPEAAKGRPVDKRADVWAFGCVLYEMLTGERLHKGDTVSETVAAVLKESPDLTRVPAHLRRLLRSCLQKDPERRLRDIGDWHLLVDDEATGDAAPARAAWGRTWMWATALGVLIIGGVAALLLTWRPAAAMPDEVRLQIPPPEGLTFNPGTQAAISPDGRWLAFPAIGSDNVSRMYVRSVSSLEVRPLPGSDGIIALSPPPFWSYDSRFVVYGAAGQLRKSEVTGTPAQVIAQTGLPFVQGGTWSQDGTIVYARNTGHLERVAAAGGNPVAVTALAAGDVAHRYPQFLPDGRRFLYLRVSGDPARSGLSVGAIDLAPEDQDERILLPTTRQAWWVASPESGRTFLLMQRDDSLLAQPFDANTLTLSGAPILVASGVGAFAPATSGLWSISRTGALIYRGGGAGFPQLTWRDLTGKVLETIGEPGDFGPPALSPDGGRVAYRLGDAQGGRDIWVRDLRRDSSPIKLTFDPGLEENPVWWHDGSRIIYAALRGARRDLYVKNADGSGAEQLLLKTEFDKAPQSVSRDGRLLLYVTRSRTTDDDLWLLPLTGEGTPFPFANSPASEAQGQISPDMRWIAFVSIAAGTPEVTVRHFPGGPDAAADSESRWLVASGGSFPRWSPTGDQLFFTTTGGEFTVVRVEGEPSFTVRSRERLFGAMPPINWSLDANGKRLLVAQPGGASGPPPPFTLVLNWMHRLAE